MKTMHSKGPWMTGKATPVGSPVIWDAVFGPDGIGDPIAYVNDPKNLPVIAAAPDGYEIIRSLAEWFAGGNSPTPSSLFDDERTWKQVVTDYLTKSRG